MDIPTFPTLYGKPSSGNKTKQWTIRVIIADDVPHIERTHGYVDHKLTTSLKAVPKGKNVGKSNETTPLQQAVSEAQSLWTKQVNAGYSETLEKQETQILPMLAHDYNKRGKDISNECYVQPKLDGVRLLAKYDGTLVSRTGKTYRHLDHIASAVKELQLPLGTYLDGELFSFELTFEEITGSARKVKAADANAEKLEFHVFDVFNTNAPEADFTTRYKTLQSLTLKHPMVLVQTHKVSKTAIKEYHDLFAEQLYEGVIVRNPYGIYKTNYRSKDLQKYKEFQDAEYRIVDVKEAVGEDAGTGVFVCIDEKINQRFNVRPKGSRVTRTEYLTNAKEYINKQLIVKYQNLSEAGIPRFPVGIGIRDYD